jgi:hypothetical protein
MCKDYSGNGQGSIQINGVTPATNQCKFILAKANNDVFYSCSEIKNGIFYSVLQYIGPTADAAKHRYKVEMLNQVSEESLTVTHLARGFGEDVSEIHNSGDCVKLYPEQHNRFANESSALAFSLDILTVTSTPLPYLTVTNWGGKY